MGNKAKREYLIAIRKRYQDAGRKTKKVILNEFCEVCGYNRKYAIRLLNKAATRFEGTLRRKRPGPKTRYHNPLILEVLQNLWRVMNLPCSRRLKAAIPIWLPYYEQHFNQPLSDYIKERLLTISHATIDRLMVPMRNKYNKLGFATTKPGSILKSHIPIKTNQWDETRPGFLEVDTVAHCGTSVGGMFVYTVNAVDIATGWNEQRAVWGKGYQGVKEAIENMEHDLPFPLRGFDCDNGGEFLNWHIQKYLCQRKQPVQYTRSRPYQKNDNAHIEEKNWSVVRQYLGYNRFEDRELAGQLNQIYTSEWRQLMNFFLPSTKLVEKYRDRSKIIKHYDQPKTPFQRILKSTAISRKSKQELKQTFETLNPFKIQQVVQEKIRDFLIQTRPIQHEIDLRKVV